MRIAFLSFSTVPFGSNDLLYFKTALLALERGYSVLVSPYDWGARNASEYDRIQKLGASVHYRPSHGRHPNFIVRQWQKLWWKLRNPTEDYRFLTEWKPDIVVLSDAGTYHMLSAPGFVDFLLDRAIPFITISQFNYENQPVSPVMFRKAQRFFGRAQKCVFVSRRNLNSAVRQLCLPLSHAVVMDNPPHMQSLEAIPFPDSPVPSMAIVARLETAVKGQAIVLEILSQPIWRERQWVLNLHGRGPDEPYLRELIAFYGLQDRVQLRGHSNDVREVWRENAILLLCSSGEGKPLALTEALVCGRPAVVSDVGGNAELVQEGVTGFLAESATLNSFGSALERAWNARTRWAEMGARGHDATVARLSPPSQERLLSLITGSPIENPVLSATKEGPRFGAPISRDGTRGFNAVGP
jgi:L-malate glycosyltransferase